LGHSTPRLANLARRLLWRGGTRLESERARGTFCTPGASLAIQHSSGQLSNKNASHRWLGLRSFGASMPIGGTVVERPHLHVNWLAFAAPLGLLLLAIAALLRRRVELRHYEDNITARVTAKGRGSHRARLQHPKVDLSQCIGCGACVRACPEDGVLALAFGQAVVVHGARCVGHGLCATACPTNAIALTLGDLAERRDLPAIDDGLEAVGVPGLFLAGEITGFALVRTAVQHGTLVAQEVAARMNAQPAQDDVLDLLVVGMGPAGLACMLAAKEHGLYALAVDQAQEIGGTVAAYPRKKLVLTQPMDLPLHGRLGRLDYTKEELIELWQGLAQQHQLEVRTGTAMKSLARREDGAFEVETTNGTFHARHVCLSLGRRGSPQKLGVPGENLSKVAYALLDAESYTGRSILVVGGGDSAVEAALALAEQDGNQVTISYRRGAFSRLKARNEERIVAAVDAGHIQVLFDSTVETITEDAVQLLCAPQERGSVAVKTLVALPNDEVFIFAGGTPPFPLLEAAGVSFDPALRPAELPPPDRGTSLLVALACSLLGLLGLLFVHIAFSDYYNLPASLRAGAELHELLRPQGRLGLLAGVSAVALFLVNLLYLWRRSPRFGSALPGTLKGWMGLHIATGLGSCLVALLHSSFLMRDSAGGHALLAMVIVVAAGVVGRWFYAFVPRAQNGRQQDLEELNTQVTAIAGEWDRHGRGFGSQVRTQIENLVEAAQLGRGFFARAFGLLRSQMRLRSEMTRLRAEARKEGIPMSEVTRVLALAQRSHRLALQLTHFEEVRGLLSVWRYLHRWLALLLVLLTVVHVVTAIRYGGVDFGVLPLLGGRG
jgi:dihydropyrimidine dehydrogenase (NAD+) subunit PreT